MEAVNALTQFKQLNKLAKKHAVVFFGTDWLCEMPLVELAETIDVPVYNRSLRGLSVQEAEEALDTCVCDLQPEKVFISLGENDLKKGNFSPEVFAEKYEWLLYAIHAKCNCEIYILSAPGDTAGLINGALKTIAAKYRCEYIDVQDCSTSFLRFFAKLRFFLRLRPITFFEAIQMQ